MILTLPLPPSVNALYANVRGRGRIKSAAYKKWQLGTGLLLVVQSRGQDDISGPYSVAIKLPAKMRGDIDNRCKALLDLLTVTGITEDDRRCQKVEIARSPYVTDGFCEVEVQAA